MQRVNTSLILYFLLLFISSIGSVIILTIFEFGGWITGDEWSSTYYYISLFGFPIDLLSIGVFVIIVLFIYSTVLSIMSLDNLSYLNPLRNYKLGMVFTAISLIMIFSLLIFLINRGFKAKSWWIGVAFYEGVICSIFDLVLYALIIRKINIL
jgi:hypothetical protein